MTKNSFLAEVTFNYSQSFQEHVVMFSSVIILSEKKNTEYSCTWIYFNIFLFIIYLIWYTVRYTVRQTLTKRTFFWTCLEEHGLSLTRKPNFCSSVFSRIRINLNFKSHIDNICCKANNKVKALFRIRSFLTLEQAKVFGREIYYQTLDMYVP